MPGKKNSKQQPVCDKKTKNYKQEIVYDEKAKRNRNLINGQFATEKPLPFTLKF